MLESEIDPDPFVQFGRWFAEACARVAQAEAMAVATATPDGRPSVRMVLLKEWGAAGFVFYTNYESRKGRELAANPRAALLLHWQPLGRQVRIEGRVERLPRAASEAYFRTRPLESRVSAAVSEQSRPIASRAELERRFTERLAAVRVDGLPLPETWGGYRVQAEAFEFWEHRDDRLHDRLRYERADRGWRLVRLQP